MASISLLQAWQLWLDGKSTLGHDLLGLPMLWWGRFGKILSFVAGSTVVVDLVGPERLSRYGQRWTGVVARRTGLVTFIAGGIVGGVAGVIGDAVGAPWPLGVALGATVGGAAGMLVVRLGRTLQDPELPMAIKWLSLGLFFVGFHFDLLAS